MAKKNKSKTGKKISSKNKDSLEILKEEIKHQKDALNKIIKTCKK